MAITNGYATLADAKAYLGITDAIDDTALEGAVEAASRALDAVTGRVFYTETATRHITADTPDLLFLPWDLVSVTTMTTDDDGDRVYETTWAANDYDLEPTSGPPYTMIMTIPVGRYNFPTQRRGVAIEGVWGYASTVPAAIKQACLIMATRYFRRKDAPFGVLGTPELGFMRITSRDPEVRQLLAPFIRTNIGAV